MISQKIEAPEDPAEKESDPEAPAPEPPKVQGPSDSGEPPQE